MVDLFVDRILVKNNKDRDELDTEREIVLRLQNRILMLRAAQLVLIFVSLDDSEDQHDKFLKELPKRCLFLNYEDPYRKELGVMFEVEEVPRVVVVRPDCSVLLPNAVTEITDLGPQCYQNWQEASEIIDRNFELHEEFDENKMRSLTDPLRRIKYKVEDEKKKKKKKKKRRGFLGGGGDEEEEGDVEDDEEDNNETEKSPW
ncbi:hypothetical protein AALO_G00096080 [Alosa alosa]|uniref:Thioredoxin-like fold domain-containing protein n=1 Tax=Alosa alosa TaxID=278164 RepID=A0AAV6GST8_9TELE|nr:hypothetical protein AALO_G00096080 [Alosa alosa]